MSDGYGQLCPECGDPYIGGPGCYAGACAAEPEDDDGSRPVTAPNPAPGEPVTNADEFSPWVASIVSAADIIRAYLDREDPDVSRLLFNQDVEGMAMALDAAGRLVAPDADTRTQWAVRKSSVPDGEGVGLPSDSREKAEFDRDRWLSHDRGYPVTAELVQREVRTWPDGSILVGPWVPVPTTPDAGEPS